VAKAISPKDKKIRDLEVGLINNGFAMAENTRKRKNWTIHDLKTIKPLNEPQRAMFEAYFQDFHIIANGSAGTGKTLASLFLALNDVLSKDRPQQRVIIVRSAVATRDLGFLPGNIDEKLEPFETPYRDILGFLTGNANAYDSMKENGLIAFMPTSFVRGLNWDDAVVVVDEVQNLNFWELNSVITRVGDNSRILIVGDQIQTDLYKSSNDKSGMDKFLKIARTLPDEFSEIIFQKEDIVRSRFVKSWICALEEAS